MALFLFNTSRFISPALVLSSLLLLIPLLPWLYLPRNASLTHPIPTSSSSTAPAADPYSPDASLPPPETHLEGRCAGRVSPTSSSPAIPEQQQGVDSSNSSEGKHGLGLLARTRALVPEVEVAAPLVEPILVAMPLEELISRPLEVLQSLLVAILAAVLWQRLCGMVILRASTQARRTLLQLRRDAQRLKEGSILPGSSPHLKLMLFQLGMNALRSLVSGSLVFILVFCACMPTTRSRMQIVFQISVAVDLLAPLLGGICLLAMETIWLKMMLFLQRLRP